VLQRRVTDVSRLANTVVIVRDIRPETDASPPSPLWVKSSLSYANGDCVQVARLADGCIGVRDSKDPGGPVLRFTAAEWAAFLGGVVNGEFTEPVPVG
jgi:Domain of unknown function (DUF397)